MTGRHGPRGAVGPGKAPGEPPKGRGGASPRRHTRMVGYCHPCRRLTAWIYRADGAATCDWCGGTR